MEKLPTYEEWTKDMDLESQIKFYYDVDIDNYLGDPWQIVAEIAEECPNWLKSLKLILKNIYKRENI